MVAGGKLEIVVKECRNIPVHSSKAVLCLVRLEFAGRSLGESSRIEVKEGEACAVFDFTALLEVPGVSQENVNEVICNPLLLTVVEVHPKDKKSKEEKTSVLGQVAIDLAPVVMEGAQFEGSLQLLQPSTDLAPPTQGSVGVVADVALKVVKPFLSIQDAGNSNLLSVRVDSLYSVPETWLPVGAPGHRFELALTVPTAEELTTTLLLNNGCLRNPPSKDPESASTHWKWPHLDPECSRVALIPGSPVEPCALEDEDGELMGKEEHGFRIRSQKELPRVTWNMEQRSWLSQDTCQRVRKNLAQCPLVPMEFIKMTTPPLTGKGKAKEEEPVPSYHGVAYVNLSSLLYPGVSKVRGAFPVLPYCETDFNDKTKVSSESHYAGVVARAQAAAALAKTKQGGGKRAASTLKASPADMLQDSEANLTAVESKETAEGQEYRDSRTYVLLEVTLQKPLIPRRTAAVLAESVAEYIPPRPAIPKRLGGAERAVKGFQDHCAEVVKCLLGEYRDMFGVPSSSANGPDQLEERRRKFLFSLNSSGKYYAFKEDLKRTIVKVVREKFISKSSTFSDPQQLQLFISELYAYLLDQMHVGMSQVLSLESPPQTPPSFMSTDLLKLFAAEAEVYSDLTLADHYHRQRLVEEDHIAAHWYDYGVHCMRCGNVEKGEQCFKQALSLDSSHVPSLILYSTCCALDERFDEGETFLEMATAKDPNNAVAWTVTGLFYELCGKPVCQNHSFRQAEICGGNTRQKTLIVPPTIKESETYLSPKHNLKNASSVSQAPVQSLRGTADTFSQASVAASTRPEATVSVVLEEELSEDSTKSRAPPVATAAVDSPSSTKKPLGIAPGEEEQEDEKPALKLSVSRVESVSIRSDETPTRKADFDLATQPAEAPTISMFLATANFLLDVGALKFAEMALAHELDLSDNQPTPAYHVACSRYFMAKREFENAISSVTVAIKEETENPAAWATLGHIHYLSGDLKEAQPAFERALAFVGDCPEIHSVHLRVGDIYLQSNQFKKAKDVFLLASQNCPSSVTWRGVGIACYRLDELENAMDALCEANILNNHDSIVWAYLTLVSAKTKRLSEAEQAYKFMMHAGMEDIGLLDEVKSVSNAFIHDIPV